MDGHPTMTSGRSGLLALLTQNANNSKYKLTYLSKYGVLISAGGNKPNC